MEKQNCTLDFTNQNIYVGLDTHLKSWTVTIRIEDDYYKTFSQNPKANVLANYLNKNFPSGNYFSAYEASFSGFNAHRELNKLGIKNIVVNPADIPTTDKERKQKDDARDSRKIASQLSKNDLTAIYVPCIENEGDRKYLRFRRTLTKDIARNKSRIKSLLYYFGIDIPVRFSDKKYWSNKFTLWLKEVDLATQSAKRTLNELIDIVEHLRKKQYSVIKNIRELSENATYKENVELLISIPGIGVITAMTFLTEIEDISRFKNLDNLCSFVGIIPMTNSTGGKDIIGDITKRRNKILRTIIVESSWVAIRNDPALMLAYQKLVKRMEPQKAIIRISKKMLNRIKYVLKNKTPYECRVVK